MEAGTRKLITLLPTVVLVALTAALSAVESAQTAASGLPGLAIHESKSMGNVAKQLNNPVADLWALNFQFNRYYLQGEATDRTREQDVMNFQPVLPVHLTSEWNLITRPVFPYIFSSPDFEPGEGWDEKSGFGDMALVSLLSPAKLTGGFIWGGGPTFLFPTATNDALGQGKYQAGPAAVGLYMGKEWVFGALGQQWWSYAGDGDRESTSQANVQYFIQYMFGDHWQIGMAPNILIDWKADQDNRFTVPVGLGIGKLVKIGPLPVKFTVEVDYMAIHPDDFGQHWGVRFQMIPVLPALFKDTLF
jgi:hypothetical protein